MPSNALGSSLLMIPTAAANGRNPCCLGDAVTALERPTEIVRHLILAHLLLLGMQVQGMHCACMQGDKSSGAGHAGAGHARAGHAGGMQGQGMQEQGMQVCDNGLPEVVTAIVHS